MMYLVPPIQIYAYNMFYTLVDFNNLSRLGLNTCTMIEEETTAVEPLQQIICGVTWLALCYQMLATYKSNARDLKIML